ncbi:MAG: multiheme c-type cytochrome [Elusimicrobiota bacterium]
MILSASGLMAEKGPGAGTPAPKSPSASTYRGAAKCKWCHIDEFMTWEKTKHARAFEALLGDEKEDPECVGCHSTGFGEGGYGMGGPEGENRRFLGVQCEACHGPGRAHVRAPSADTITRTPAGCARCHDAHRECASRPHGAGRGNRRGQSHRPSLERPPAGGR